MAKGLRASVNKRNKSKLRSRVFGPVEDARTERLSAKLLELAQQPKPVRSEMEVDGSEGKEESTSATSESKAAAGDEEDMDIDASTAPKIKPAHSSSSKDAKKGRRKVEKRRHRKEKNNITFKKVKPRRTKDRIGRA
ncbi:uncharacterized protein PV09_07697 [Verruconis gallopava]|uniref:DUF2423 domain-containing protein n=1 Tax=Verruconis gallopava TaxID=253628 RepID=A0A0D1YIM0_9PEZI|nr:uncharacterized protein PV09_07697 [Verruconis gallopava]KIW00712.1 hypothetical protein PV09_07697 [Verruconis gallopava]